MSEIYQSYELELTHQLEAVRSQLSLPLTTPNAFKQVRAHLSDCEKNLKLMQTELSGNPSAKKHLNSKLRAYKKTFNDLRKQIYLKESDWELEVSKKELMGTRPSSSEGISLAGDRSQEVTEQLRDSVRVMYQNLEIDEGVNQELKRQSGVMVGGKTKLQQIRHDLVKGERKIKSMMMRARKNKCIVRAVLAFLFLIVAALIVSFFR